MSKKTKQRKVHARLRTVRMFAYTAVSFTILQYIGIFALAGIRGMYVKTDSKLNAFYPKTYVNVELKEKDNGEHVYVLNDEKEAIADDATKSQKQLYVKNPATNKKDVLVRARIIAVIHKKDGTAIGQTQNYEITGTALTKNTGEEGMWYNVGVDVVDGSDTERKYLATDNNCFYYTSVLEINTQTENLFDNVILTDIENIPEDGWVEFQVIVDTVEVVKKEDGSYDFTKAKNAWGEEKIEMLTALVK